MSPVQIDSSRKSISISDIEAFIAVAQTQSFTRAAEQTASTKSSIGKAIKRLESHLNVRLLQRTTRAVRLTEDGEIYLEAARSAVEGLLHAKAEFSVRGSEPSGRVRVDVAAGLGNLIVPTLGRFHRQFPQINLELGINDRPSNPVADGWDLVIRIGELPSDGGLVVRKLGSVERCFYASPDYLERYGVVENIDDLRDRDGIVFKSPSGHMWPWSVPDAAGFIEIMPSAVLVVSDSRTMLDATVAGVGIAQLYNKVALPYVRAGSLIHLLPELKMIERTIHAIIPVGRRMPARIRAVLEHISQVLNEGTE
ncbi:LysR family transcriptional regulator [Rhizobium brockwellii]|uniref:LysR family transcriptional regulator n=1 Tax=Rhizobium brockwellii TaxID=3019932 RepID=UPI003F99ADDB